jgi:hypothetical protein
MSSDSSASPPSSTTCQNCQSEVGADDFRCPICDEPIPGRTAPARLNAGDAFSSIGLAQGVVDGRAKQVKTPHVGLGPTEVQGAVEREAVARVIRKHIDQLLACYNKRLQARSGLHGKITVAFMILPKGAVSRAEMKSSTLADPALESCVMGALPRWTFPRPTNGGVARVQAILTFEEE